MTDFDSTKTTSTKTVKFHELDVSQWFRIIKSDAPYRKISTTEAYSFSEYVSVIIPDDTPVSPEEATVEFLGGAE